MHDTDRIIQNITGSKDYLKELEKVTGNIMTIDKKFFNDVITKCMDSDINIRIVLMSIKQEMNNEFDLAKEFFTKSIDIDYNKAIITEKKKNGKIKKYINPVFRPEKFIKSEYFKLLKQLEKTANRMIEAYGLTEESLQNVLKTQPDLPEVKNFFGYKPKNMSELGHIISIQHNAATIIENYMKPLYDIKSIIEKNWHLLDPLFKKVGGSITVENYEISQQEVKDMLYLFIVAKYRCTITDNNKYYVKLFMNVLNKGEDEEVSQSSLGKMDAARFLELLDTINLENIDKKQNVYKFAEKSKSIIKKIVNKKEGDSTEDIMKEIESVMKDVETTGEVKTDEQEQQSEQTTEQVAENADVLADLV